MEISSEEFAPFYSGYINRVNGRLLSETLIATMGEALSFFSEIENGDFAYAPEKWSIKAVLQHVIDCERIFVYRALCISRGEQIDLPGFDEDKYADNALLHNRSLSDLVDEFTNLRLSTIDFFCSLNEEVLQRRGKANGSMVSVRAIGYILSGHLLHHMDVIKERYLTQTDYNSSATTS